MSFGSSSSTPPVKPRKAPKVVTKKQTHTDQEAAKKAVRAVAKRGSTTTRYLLSAKADGVTGAPAPNKSYATTVLGGSGMPKAGF